MRPTAPSPRARRRPRSRLGWLAGYWVLVTPVLIHRASFHYYFIPLALASIMSGYLIWDWAARIARDGGRRRFWVSALFILMLHTAAMVFYGNSRSQDARFYRTQWQPYHQALDLLPYGQQIAVVASDPQVIPPLWHVHGIYPQLIPPSTPLQRAFEELFTFPSSESGVGRHRVGVVLSLTADGPSIQRAVK